MKKLLTLLFSLTATAAFAQFTAPTIQWQKSLGGSNGDAASAVQQTSDGGYIIAGYSSSINGDVTVNHGNNDFWIVKLNDMGIIQWQKSFGGTADEVAASIQQTADSGYIVAGYSFSTDGDVIGNQGESDVWVVKLNDLGVIQWQKSFGGTAYEGARSIHQTTDGGYIVAGFSNSSDGDVTGNHGSYDYWIVKLDGTGALEWQKSLGGTDDDYVECIQQTLDKGYIIIGSSFSTNGDVIGSHGTADYWLVKLDTIGNLQWQKTFGGSNGEIARSIQQTSDSGYVAVGYSYSTDGDVTGVLNGVGGWVVKMDDRGVIQWQESLQAGSLLVLAGAEGAFAQSIQQTTDSGYVIAGFADYGSWNIDGWHKDNNYTVFKLSKSGTLQWQKNLGGSSDDEAQAIQQAKDGSYIVTGYSSSTDGDVTGNHGSSDMWVVKLYPESPTAVSTHTTTESFTLFPNPVTNEVRIQTNETIRSVLITDISGKEVFRAGAVDVIPTATLANGLYLVRVQTANGTTTQKLVVQH